MITDSQGNRLQEHSVVVDNSGNLWSVVCFDVVRACSVKCRNGTCLLILNQNKLHQLST